MKREMYVKAGETGLPVEIYSNREFTDKFSAGYVVNVSDTKLLLGSVDNLGQYDGYTVKKLEDIFLMQSKTVYCEKLHKLYGLKKQSHILSQSNIQGDLFLFLLEFAKKEKKIVSVELSDSGYGDVVGYVKEFSEEIVIIKRISQDGEVDGEGYFNLCEVTSMSCDSQEEAALNLLSCGE